MKKSDIKVLALIALSSAMVASCDLMKDVDYKITPNPLEEHGDSVRIRVDATLPEKGIKKKASAEITPTFGDVPLKTITILGEKAVGNGTTINFKAGGKVTYTDVIAYQPSFENADLQITGKIYKGTKEKKTIEPITVAKGTIITPFLVRKDFKVEILKDNFQRTIEYTKDGQVNFDKAKSVLRPKEMKRAENVSLKTWFADTAKNNPKIAIKSVDITGYASPEGEVAKNESLSSDRATTGKTVTLKLAKEAKNDVATNATYNLKGSGEDWEGFKKELQKSSMKEDEKQLVLRVLEMYSDPTQRDQEIQNMSKTFNYLEKNVLPQLRRAEIKVVYDKTGYSDEELKQLSKTNIDTLNVEEMLFTATLTDDPNEQLRIYQAAEKKYPNDVRAVNNVGVAMYELGQFDAAKAQFEKANSMEQHAEISNNLAAIAGTKGDRKEAKSLLTKAGSSDVAKYNKGILAIQDGDYGTAVANLGDKNYNKALAQILNGDNSGALTTINNSPDAQTADGYYLKAIIAARQDKLADIVSNLKDAFVKNPSLKTKAAKDMEFYKYFENATFTAILK